MLTRKDHIRLQFAGLSKGSAEPCYELLDKLLKNIIESQGEEDKFRSIKQESKVLTQSVTRHKQGKILMDLVGFQTKEGMWTNQGSVSYLKGIRLDLQGGYSASVC